MANLNPVKGTKYDYSEVNPGGTVQRPCFSINDTDLPAINKWKVGDKYKVTVEIEMCGIRESGDMAKPKGNVAEFEIYGIAPYKETTAQMRQRLTKN